MSLFRPLVGPKKVLVLEEEEKEEEEDEEEEEEEKGRLTAAEGHFNIHFW